MSEEIKEKIKAYYIANDIDKILNYITNLQQKVEQLEDIRKETIEYIKQRTIFGEYIYAYPGILNQDEVRKILNILNKGSEK